MFFVLFLKITKKIIHFLLVEKILPKSARKIFLKLLFHLHIIRKWPQINLIDTALAFALIVSLACFYFCMQTRKKNFEFLIFLG